MVARRKRHHSPRQVCFRNRVNEIRSAPDLERSPALEILALEKRVNSRTFVECARGQHRRSMRDIFYALGRPLDVRKSNAHWAFSSTTMVSTGSRSLEGNRSSVPPGISFTSTVFPLASSVA